MRRKICFLTGSRAEYGLLKPLMKTVEQDKNLELQIIALAMHMSNEFGLTYKKIEDDGFKIDEKITMLISSDESEAIAASMGVEMISLAKSFTRIKPDILVFLGDRFELLAAASTALVMNIPMAHLAGGEVTEGAFDDSIRNALTKMAHLHFPFAEQYKNRIIQMGENPEMVFNYGSTSVDNFKEIKLLDRKSLEKNLGMQLKPKNFVITFHPVTREQDSIQQFQNLLSALDQVKKEFDDVGYVFTMANADPAGREINAMIENYCNDKTQASYVENLGVERYFSLLAQSCGMIGNSSSGITEGPLLKIGSLNIGNRQKGRLKAASVMDCSSDTKAIIDGIKKILSEDFQKSLAAIQSPFDYGGAAYPIKEKLKNISLQNIIQKKFFDIKS